MQTEVIFQVQKTPGVLRVPSGSASSPSSRYWYRLSVPLRWWHGSKLRTMAEECRNFPLRIGAILTAPHPHNSVQPGSPYPSGYGRENPCAEYKFQDACSDHVRQLSHGTRWLGLLDARIAAESFRQGATWGHHNACNSNSNVKNALRA